MMLHELPIELIFRRIDVERSRGTPLGPLMAIVRDMLRCQRACLSQRPKN